MENVLAEVKDDSVAKLEADLSAWRSLCDVLRLPPFPPFRILIIF